MMPLRLLFLLLAASWTAAAPAIARAETYRGEDCARCHGLLLATTTHAMRIPAPAGEYDVIVIGGNLSGLAAAHYLSDLNILLLESEEKVGGHARRLALKSGLAPVAAAHMGRPSDVMSSLLNDLGVELSSFPVRNGLFVSSEPVVVDWLNTGLGQTAYPEEVKTKLRRLNEEVRRLVESEGMTVPIENSKFGVLKLYDRAPFSKYLEDLYGQEVAKIGDLYSRDVFGIQAGEVSAFAGLYSLKGEFEEAYTGIGGIGEVAEALGRELGENAWTGSFPWRVSQDTQSVVVEFDRGGKSYQARAKTVVWAVPSLVVKRVAADLSASKRRAMNAVRYSAYVTVPFTNIRPLAPGVFTLWNSNAFFTSLAFPLEEPGSDGQVMVAYVPYGGEPGRRRLQAVSDGTIRYRVLQDLDKMFPGISSDVREMQVVRWGHALPVPYPEYLMKVRPVIARPENRYFFAGEETQLPGFEGAVYSGYLAAMKVRKFLGAPDLSEADSR